MIRFRDISIKRKLTLIIMAASTVALLLAFGRSIACELFTYREAMSHDLSTLAEIIGNRSSAALIFEEKGDAEETLNALIGKRHIVAAALYTREGKLLARYPRGQAVTADFPLHPEKECERFEKDDLVIFHEIRVKGDM